MTQPHGQAVRPPPGQPRPRPGRRAEGARLFARYAFAPNELGYCGPADGTALFDFAATGGTGTGGTGTGSTAGIAGIARRFHGAWPYLVVLAELAGLDDPLDERVVRAYWTGGPLLHQADRAAFGARLLAVIGPQAGHYWAHLSADLLPEVTATHAFHVLGVYPWSRLLASGQPEHPLRVLDMCRIRWGRVITRHQDHVVVASRHLTWDGSRLGLSAPTQERVRIAVDGVSFVPDTGPGDWLALHWDWACERLSAAHVADLRHWTRWQLVATNNRLAAAGRKVSPRRWPSGVQSGSRGWYRELDSAPSCIPSLPGWACPAGLATTWSACPTTGR